MKFSIVAVGCLALCIAGCGSEAVAPTSYATFSLKGEPQSIALEYPEGWAADGGGKSNHWGKFSQGSAEISFQTDIAGSLMADAGGMAMPIVREDGTVIQPEPPVVKLHAAGKEKVAEEYSGYQEEETPDVFRNALGEGRKSEFIADGGLGGGKMHGFRATFLSRDRRFTVICTCPHSDWRTLRPAFDHVLDSFKTGG
jgi:hypothetical protein